MTDKLPPKHVETLKYDQLDGRTVKKVFDRYINRVPRHPVPEHKPSGAPATTFYKPGDVVEGSTVPDNWERKSSFDDEQLEYIFLLNKTISNLIRGDDTKSPKPLSQRLSDQMSSTHNYENAAKESTLSIIQDVCEFYPNLIPVLNAFLIESGAGATGISIAINDGVRGITKEEAQSNYKQFVGAHIIHEEYSYELTCKGIPIALEILNQFRKADEINPELKNFPKAKRLEMTSADSFPKIRIIQEIKTLVGEQNKKFNLSLTQHQ